MKKILCLALCVMMMLSSITTFAATKEVGAYETGVDIYNVYVGGKADVSGQSVTILLMDYQGNIGYINELDTTGNGEYETKFKFSGNINNYEVKVRDSVTSEDITNSLKTAFAKHELYGIDISVVEAGNDVISYITQGGMADIVAKINNKYGNFANVSVVLAAYDENNKLVAIDTQIMGVDYEDLNTEKTIDFSDFTFPDETKSIKAFAWQDTINLVPLAKEDVKSIGTSLAFKNDNPNDTKVIGVIGDSITHWGHYTAFLYEYYATRYPNSNIVILNKGLSGDTGAGVISRLEWDIFSENDPLKYGACDEVTIMVGMNDSGYSAYTYGKMDDDEYLKFYTGRQDPNDSTKWIANMQKYVNDCINNVETIVNYCITNNKPITIVTPSLYDESDRFVNTYPPVRYGANYAIGLIAEGLRELGKTYNVPVLDLYKASNEYSDSIREKYPEATTVITQAEGIHPIENGGYLFGYLFARAQETNNLVASVEIDATSGSNKTDNASVTDVNATSSSVSYTYLANAIPLYVGSSGYKYTEGYGVDITNNMNKEIIKVTNLDEGTYTVSMDSVEIGTFTNKELAVGVNIAALGKNPAQIQAKEAFSYKEIRRSTENNYRSIINTEMYIRNRAKGHEYSKYYPAECGYDFDNFTDEKWLEVATKMRNTYVAETGDSSKDKPIYGISDYISEHKINQGEYVNTIRNCIENINNACKPVQHNVKIYK